MQTQTPGGRMRFDKTQPVRVFTLEGVASDEVYSLRVARADRHGFVDVVVGFPDDPEHNPEHGARKIHRVTQRRILPESAGGMAIAVEVGGKPKAVCPIHHRTGMVDSTTNVFKCSDDCVGSQLFWTGVRSMSDTATKPASSAKKQTPAKAAKTTTRRPAAKAKDAGGEVDFAALKKIGTLFTRSDVQFNHATIDVKAHALIINDAHPRKLCFNTYGGRLGKRQNSLPLDDFAANKSSASAKWYSISDLAAEIKRMESKGYVKEG